MKIVPRKSGGHRPAAPLGLWVEPLRRLIWDQMRISTWDSLFFSFALVPEYNFLVSECNCPVSEYNFEFLHCKFPNTTGKVPNINTCFWIELPVSEYTRLVSEHSHDLYIELAIALLFLKDLKVVDLGSPLFNAVGRSLRAPPQKSSW